MSNTKKGKQGEEIAVKYLKENGYKILETNYHYSKFGEIDIIAIKHFKLCAIEVKSRTNLIFGEPFEAITKAKLDKIFMTFKYYLQNTKIAYFSHQIDAISVIFDAKNPSLYEIKHIKNIEL